MEKFEKQFEDLDVQSGVMENSMSNSVTASVPQVCSRLTTLTGLLLRTANIQLPLPFIAVSDTEYFFFIP
jgi:hypothetical protein